MKNDIIDLFAVSNKEKLEMLKAKHNYYTAQERLEKALKAVTQAQVILFSNDTCRNKRVRLLTLENN
jgi:hypothetical protein